MTAQHWMHVTNFGANVGGYVDLDGQLQRGPIRLVERLVGTRRQLKKVADAFRARGFVVAFEPVVVPTAAVA